MSTIDAPANGTPRTRFAPSPTGRMHAGNIYAALTAWLLAKSQGGSVVLRIEDLDRERSKACYVDALQRDFEMLGLTWDDGPFFQHDRNDAYQEALELLRGQHLVYPCYCTRADLHAASAPHFGEKPVYAGTCRSLSPADRRRKEQEGRRAALRLEVPDVDIAFCDQIQGPYRQNLKRECGDFLIRRSDESFAYQLAVVVDDAAQGITQVTRGVDLLCSTPQQIFLQQRLGLSTPSYAHIPLLVSTENRRLSKRNHDASLEELMRKFQSPSGVIGYIAGVTGLAPSTEPISPEELLPTFSLEKFRQRIDDPVQVLWRSSPIR